MRRFENFRYREAAFSICSGQPELIRQTIVQLRQQLDEYLVCYPAFGVSLQPLESLPGQPPDVARRMHAAATLVGVGPMAAVAGTVSQLAVEAAVAAGCQDCIVNNGGDIFMQLNKPADIGIHGGNHALADRVAFRIEPGNTPLALCSSSSKMGHSLSLGDCDLATVCAADGALADAAATLAANLSCDTATATAAAERVCSIEGIRGVLILVGGEVICAGELPELVSCCQETVRSRVVRHPESG